MTIKRRLFISTILMLIIPAALAVITLMASLLFFFVLAFPHAEYRLSLHEELMEMRGHVLELATDWLSDSNVAHKNEAESSLSRIVERNQLTIQIKEGRSCCCSLEAGQFPLRIGWSRLWRHWMGKAPFLTEVSNYTASLSRQMERTIKLLSIIRSFPCQV